MEPKEQGPRSYLCWTRPAPLTEQEQHSFPVSWGLLHRDTEPPKGILSTLPRDAQPSSGTQRRHFLSQDPAPDPRIQILSSPGAAGVPLIPQQPEEIKATLHRSRNCSLK